MSHLLQARNLHRPFQRGLRAITSRPVQPQEIALYIPAVTDNYGTSAAFGHGRGPEIKIAIQTNNVKWTPGYIHRRSRNTGMHIWS